MGILFASKPSSTVELVYSEDDEVTLAKGSPRGWVARKDALAVRGGATVVKVSPLGPDDDARASDAGGLVQSSLARVRAGLRAVNGNTSDEAREAFVDLCPRDPRFLLGVVIRALTEQEDIAAPQEFLFRRASGMGARQEGEEGADESEEAGEVEV